MDRLDETFAGGRYSPGTYVGAAVFVAGVVLVGVGALSTLMDALAGAASSGLTAGVALAGAGLAVTTVLSVATLVLHGRAMDGRVRAGLVGSALAIVLVVPAWTATPGLVGTGGVLLAGLLYVAGSLTLTGVVFEGAVAADGPTGSRRASYVSDSRVSGLSPGVADGGSDDDDLEFLLDEDDRD
jgi:hypothetical protein